MFAPQNHKQLETSFQEFCRRPENQHAVEEAQRQEMRQALKLKETVQWLEFEKKLDRAGPAVQQALSPFLKHKVLRRVVQTFGNAGAEEASGGGLSAGDPAEDALSAWATNPRVLGLLQQAQQLLESGAMSEKQLEHLLVQQLKDPKSDAKQEFEATSSRSIVLSPEQLVSALNEHLEERRKGNAAHKAGKLQQALESYQRALAIVEFVRGGSPSDQAEVDRNKVAVLLNLAATSLALKDFGAAASNCVKVLELEPGNETALLRRAKAFVMRREFQAAERDMRVVEELPGGASGAVLDELDDLRSQIKGLRISDSAVDKALYARMFR